jgi:hypothetical protein
VKGSPGEQDESLLDNWIKELESGIQGMADLTGAPAEVNNMHTLVVLIRYMYGPSESEYHILCCYGYCVRWLCSYVGSYG